MKIKDIKSKKVRKEAIRLVEGVNPLIPFMIIRKLDLAYHFDWKDSPQGYDFWEGLYEGVIKNTKDLELPESKETTYSHIKEAFDSLFSDLTNQLNDIHLEKSDYVSFFDAITDRSKEEYSPEDYVNHPDHYGGEDDPYEVIKIIEAWDLNFNLGNVVKYVLRAGIKDVDTELEDLKKALWYIQREIDLIS